MPQLNKEQQLAVMHRDGPMLVLAGPGSGKTAVLVNRVLHLIRDEHVDPHNILVLTFSRLAAGEMRSRFINLANASYPVTFGTFHAIFYHILKRQGLYRSTEILTQKKKLTLLGITARRLKLKCCDDPEKLEKMRAAFEKGYAQAEKTWGGELPDISKRTFDAVMKGFDELTGKTETE